MGAAAAYNLYTGMAVRGDYRSTDTASIAGIQTNKGSGAVAWDTPRGDGAVGKTQSGNVYAGMESRESLDSQVSARMRGNQLSERSCFERFSEGGGRFGGGMGGGRGWR